MASHGQSLLALIRQQRFVPTVLLVVMVLALVNWVLRPDEALRWLSAMLTLPALWLGLWLWHLLTLRSRRRRGIDEDSAVTRYFGSAMTLVCLSVGLLQIVVFGLAIWVAIGGHRADLEIERRILGLTVSAVLILVGNALPKILTPLSMLPREQAALVTVARRFVGTTSVVLGLLTAIAFIAAPLTLANSLLRWALVAGLLAFVGAIVWMNVAAARLKG